MNSIQLSAGLPILRYEGIDYQLGLSAETEDEKLVGTVIAFDDTGLQWAIGDKLRCFQRFIPIQVDGGAIALKWELEVDPVENLSGILQFELAILAEQKPYFLIPGALYGDFTLADSRSLQPQLSYREKGNYPRSDYLRTRADRSTHNAVIMSGRKQTVALNINEVTEVPGVSDGYIENGISIDVRGQDAFDRIAVSMGYQHFPKLYRGKLGDQSVSQGPVGREIHFQPGTPLSTSGLLYVCIRKTDFTHNRAVEFIYSQIHQPPGNDGTREESVRLIAKAIAEDAYQKDYHYFPTVLSGERPDTGVGGDTAWTGGMQVVYPLARAFRSCPPALEVCVDYVENLTQGGFNSDVGLFFESKIRNQWSTTAWWTELIQKHHPNIIDGRGAHSAYVNGQASCYLLKLVDFLETHPEMGMSGVDLDRWKTVAMQVIDHALEYQREDGAFGIYYHVDDGRAIHWEGCQGLWFMAAAAEAYRATREGKYLAAVKRADQYYFKFLRQGCLWGMPMDTGDAPDQECGLPYITAAKTLHQATNDREFLQRLLQVLDYDFTWKFAYNTRHRNEPLKTLKWPSCGGCITSSHNIHIHQMGNLIAEELYYAWQETKDPYLLSRLRDTLNWGLGTYNLKDQYFGFGKVGWATEQFFHSDGVQDDPERIPEGGIWPDFLCWASACVLLSNTADIPDDLFQA